MKEFDYEAEAHVLRDLADQNKRLSAEVKHWRRLYEECSGSSAIPRSERRRVRFVEWMPPHYPNWELCTVVGAAELGVPITLDDDLILLYPPGVGEDDLVRWENYLRQNGLSRSDGQPGAQDPSAPDSTSIPAPGPQEPPEEPEAAVRSDLS